MSQELFSEETQIINIILIAISLLLFMAIALIGFFYFSRRRIIKTQLEKATLEIAHQREMLQASISTQENERKRIAQDLHDAISSKLNIVSLNANLLLEIDSPNTNTHNLISTILEISNTTLESSRRIAHDLLPPVLEEFGLKAAIEELASDFNQSKKVHIIFESLYKSTSLPVNDELHVFRIVQELINNSIRHGKASEIIIKITSNPFTLIYTDNGVGFNKDEFEVKKGLGMKNIESRAEMLNGNGTFISSENNGIQFSLSI